MEVCCDLQVDVNGEEVFMVDKKTLTSFSGRFSKLFGKLAGTSRSLKVIFHDFPGGAEGFELMARFCYSNGRTEITPSNIVLLYCIAHFMEMDGDAFGTPNILYQTKKSLEGISFWTWSMLLVALKQCQDLLPVSNTTLILQKVLDCLVGKLFSPFITSPYASSSSENLSFHSSNSRSSHSLKTNCSQTTWWFGDLVFLSLSLLEKVIRRMIVQELDHSTISKFLFHYLQSKSFGATPGEKCKTTEVVISLISLLDRSSLSYKGLFILHQVALSMKISKQYRTMLENMIGSQLDQATINYILVPSPHGKKYAYDVNLVLRFVKSFLLEGGCDHLSRSRLKKVAKLMDSYLAEVAPDSHLNPSKFAALAIVLPDSARESHDRLYQAIGVYFKRHTDLYEEEKMDICCALNYKKLSAETLKHLAHNTKFPSRRATETYTQQCKLRSLFQEAYHLKTLDSLLSHKCNENENEKEDSEQILRYTKKLDYLPTEAQRLRAESADLQRMHMKALELGKDCGTMQMQMAAIMQSRLSFRGSNISYLPKLFP